MFHPQTVTRINSDNVERATRELSSLVADYGIGAVAAALKALAINELRGKLAPLGWDMVWLRVRKAATYILEPVTDCHVEIRRGDTLTRYYPEDTQLEQIEAIADPDPNYEWLPFSICRISPELASNRLKARSTEDGIKWSDLDCSAAVIVTFHRHYSPLSCRKSWSLDASKLR